MTARGPVRWGVLGAAKIARTKVIPAMQKSDRGLLDVVAIASRSLARAEAAANDLRIPVAHGSYEALLDDPEVDAVYIPLPNHLHVPWAIRALEAGKHVLVEKPLALDVAEAEELLAAARAHPHLKAMEAFMYRFHPQWRRAKAIVDDGSIGDLRTVHSFFSYFKRDPDNVRNRADMGGGGLMDIGCYDISLARFLFGAEPTRVVGAVEFDPDFEIDRLASAILEFEAGTATFTCGTQITRHQRAEAFGTHGSVELTIPFNAPQDGPTTIRHKRGDETVEITYDRVDQYQLQGEAMSRAILDDAKVPTPLEDGVANMRVIEAIFQSAETGGWVDLA